MSEKPLPVETIVQMTGRTQPAAQERRLRAAGIHCVRLPGCPVIVLPSWLAETGAGEGGAPERPRARLDLVR